MNALDKLKAGKPGPKPLPLDLRLERRIVKCEDTGCWEWTGYLNEWGYGRLTINRKVCLAHRIAYEVWRGPIPNGLELDHLCRNRKCINPDHLEAVDHRTNTLRGETVPTRWAARTECDKGHPLTEENIHWYGPNKRWRQCATCFKESWKRKNKAAWAKRQLAKSGGSNEQQA